MQSDPSSGPGRDAQQRPKRTPNTDMQPEDAGTPDSGNPAGDTGRGEADPGRDPAESGRGTADPGRGTAAEPGMKQTSKTDSETGSRR
jgi:hypothetical protein